MTTQVRAKAGGEVGANGEFYEGGQFLNTVPANDKRPGHKKAWGVIDAESGLVCREFASVEKAIAWAAAMHSYHKSAYKVHAVQVPVERQLSDWRRWPQDA